ncbi:hypothetical protein LCGC14_0428440 [marine sediment metagenome]|uniref:Uncharacterized protein n=1 Tax=marine sediment metagenome TaxID=412755 RepID=A0A0F9SUW6_9ZZZZ
MSNDDKPELKECEICKRMFPDLLIVEVPYVGERPRMCPICALEVSNQAHGLNRTEFNGTMANEMLFEARAFLIKEAEDAE